MSEPTHRRPSQRPSPPRTSMLLLSGFAAVASCASGGCVSKPIAIEVFTCPDPPERTMQLFSELPIEWQEWFFYEYDPFCEGLARVAYGERD